MKSQIYSIQITISNFGPGFINAVIEVSRDPHYNDQAKLDTHMYAHVTKPSFFRMQRAQLALCNGDFWTPPNKSLNADRTLCQQCGAEIPNDGNCWFCENSPIRAAG